MGLWHDLRALDMVESRMRDYRASVDEGGAAIGDPITHDSASSYQHTVYTDSEGAWHEMRSVSEPISTGAADAAVRDWDEPFEDECTCNNVPLEGVHTFLCAAYSVEVAPLVDYAGEDTVAESMVREFVDDVPFEGDGAWGDIGVCTGCGASGRVFTDHRTNLNDPFDSWCGEYR